MITEDYCSYEVAKLLKEKGFNEATNRYYNAQYDAIRTVSDTFMTYWNNEEHMKVLMMEGALAIPTHQMAMAWLREHGFHINAVVSYDYSVDADGNEVDRWTFWLFEIFSSFSGNLIYTEEVNEYDSYEEAVEAAIKYCIENLI